MPGGRPDKLDQIVERDANGEPVTASQKVLDAVRSIWRPRKAVAAAGGITCNTLDHWIKAGAQARERAARGEKLTQRERRYMEFLRAYEKAEGEAIAMRVGGIQRAAQQRERKITKTTTKQALVKNPDTGKQEVVTLTETTTTTELVPGEWTALAWQLERGLDDFARRVQIEGVRDGNPIVLTQEQRAERLADGLQTFLEGAATQRDVTREHETNGHA